MHTNGNIFFTNFIVSAVLVLVYSEPSCIVVHKVVQLQPENGQRAVLEAKEKKKGHG